MKLVLENLSKSFPGRRVFQNISAQIEQGKTLVVTGPNGSGKTTLIKIICSLLPASSGKVIFQYNGNNYTDAEIQPYIGCIAPDLFLYDELTAMENLGFFASVSNIKKPDIKMLLDKYGLMGRGKDLVKSYSSGMKQRLKYILALMRNPQILLLDEPAVNLDEQGKRMVDEVIRDHKGIAVIATNNKDELKYADYTINLGQ